MEIKALTMIEIFISIFSMICRVDPRALNIDAAYNISYVTAGRTCKAPHFPYF